MLSREQFFMDSPELSNGGGAEIQDRPPSYEHEAVLDALGRLEPVHRLVLIAREVEGLNYDQIAKRHSFTEDEVKYLIWQAREEMVVLLKGKSQ